MDEEEYYKKCKDPSTWFFAGRQMYNAADTLLDTWTEAINKPIPRLPFSPTSEELKAFGEHMVKCGDLFPAYIMLMGYALENLSKGLMIMEKTKPGGPQANQPNLTIKELGVVGHNTLERLNWLEVILSPEEEEAVLIAADHVVWAGKYGVPRDPGKHEASEGMSISVKDWQKYVDPLSSLFDRLYNEYRERACRYFNLIIG
jgi:hypothetical protein